MIAGLASRLPVTLANGLRQQGVAPGVAHQVAALPPVSSLFAAVLGVNPLGHLLAARGGLAGLPAAARQTLTGREFFPGLISGKWIRCCAWSASSSASQKRCPAAVVGTSVAASASADRRGNRPSASSRPAAIWTAPLSRTASSALAGTAGIRSASGRTTDSARDATRSGRRNVS
jgi:hypothetical protein